MSSVVALAGTGVVVLLACWAALLALAAEAPRLGRSLADPPAGVGETVPLERALHSSRLGIMLLAAAAGAVTLGRESGGALVTVGEAALLGGFLYVLGDLLPRAAGALLPRLAAAAAPAARRSILPFGPLLGVVAGVERGIEHVLPSARYRPRALGEGERDLLAGILSLEETTVEQIMTPRLDIEAIALDEEWDEVVEQWRRAWHARLPVFRGDLDDIVGIVYGKDFTPAVAGVSPPPGDWRTLIRPAHFIPESKTLVAQLRDFQRERGHLAIVVDEFGGTSGLLTLEDVLEEVVGEIHGEYERAAAPPIQFEGDDRYWVDGAVTLDALSETVGTEIAREGVTTVGGLVYSDLGRVPHPGEELRIGDFRLVVERVVRRRVQRVYLERLRKIGADAETEA